MSCQLQQTGSRSNCVGTVGRETRQQSEGLLASAIGPYPDEVIMLALDRILYYMGVSKIMHKLELSSLPGTLQVSSPPPTPPPCAAPRAPAPCTVACSTSTCSLLGAAKTDSLRSSNSCLSKYTSARSQQCSAQPAANATKASSLKSLKVTVPASPPRPRTTRVDFAHPVLDDRLASGGSSISTRLKQSLSGCSIACRRFKGKLSRNKEENCVWTRLVHSENGSKLYEVYQNCQEKKPWKSSTPKTPVIVFLVLPNGYVMPFESLPSSLKENES